MRGQECRLLVLARPHLFNHIFQPFFLTTLTSLDAMQRRSARVPIPKRHFEDVSGVLPPKKRQKSAQIDSLSGHIIERRKGHGYCVWGRRYPEQCQQGKNNGAGARVVLGEVVRATIKRPRQVNSFCTRCNVYLCIKQRCYRHWHVY